MAEPIYCPFCGTTHALVPECAGRWQQIVCGACGARGPEVYRWLPYRTAVESWNVRQEPTDTNTTHRPDGVKVNAPSVEDRLKMQSGPFKGKPQGWFTRDEVLAILATYGVAMPLKDEK